MNKSIFMKINAVLLALTLSISAICTISLYKVYANENPDDTNNLENPEVNILSQEGEQNTDGDIQNPPIDDYQPDPFDYDLTCYTPNLNFGQITQDAYATPLQFSIVNTGTTEFPLTWDEYDQSTAFELEIASGAIVKMTPGSTVPFMITPDSSLPAGTYTAYYVFYSGNDIRQTHRVQVNVSMSIKKNEPFIASVEVIPGNVSLAVGNSYQFKAVVSGGNDYDPTVYWSVAGNSSNSTTIDSDGKLNISGDETATTIAVIATSKQNSSYYDSAIVNITTVDHIVSISADPTNGGAIAGGGAVRNGGSMRVSASPNNNFSFAGWYEGANLISTSPQFDLTNITSDRRLVAKFNRTTCYIKTSVNNSEGGTITDSCTIQSGSNITITAKPKNGYAFKEFVENNKTLSTSNSIQLNNVTTDRNIIAVFVRNTVNVYVSVSPSDTGKYEGAGTYDKGKKVTIKQQAYDGYEFAGWVINGQIVSYNSEYVIEKIENDLNITATFRKKQAITYKMTSGITNEGGAIVPSGEYVVQEGGSVTYQIVPSAGYKVKNVTVDGKNIGAVGSYTFNSIGNNHSITATFEKVATPASNQNTSKQQSVTPKKSDTPKTEYNESTANKGALPEQKVVKETNKKDVEELEGEEYIEDTYVPLDDGAQDKPIEDTIVDNNIMAKYGLDEPSVRKLINDNAEMALLKEAYETGTLQVTVNNSFADFTQETSQGLYFDNPSIVNFETVVSATLTEDEKISVLSGTPVLFNVTISENTATVDASTKKLMERRIGYKPLCYFDFFVMKSSGGNTQILDRTGSELLVCLPIPNEYKKSKREYCILRNHNGTVDILTDLDDNPDTITFKTDKFSEYSIAYEAVNMNKLVLRLIIIILISLVLALICYINLWRYRRAHRRRR